MGNQVETDLFIKKREEDYREYKEDLEIATNELTKMKSYDIVNV